ncbi:MAG: cytochrome c biogenesis protein CcsA [Chloroflexi bacterium]|nr:cytochrome c biogenesis protein CcsA [Chloroflexota bacterium]MDA1147315.1 cytochrome c biogenesis protein CcsA [Chloroflexota bacterium]
MIATLGASALLTALASSLFAAGAAVYGHRARRAWLVLASRRAILVTGMLMSLAVATLAYALLANDFSIAHVASVSSSDMQPWMKWASLYSGQPGSLLFWTWTMSLFMAVFAATTLRQIPWGAPHALATMGFTLAAFLVALVFFASPFRVSAITPADGQGLNPLLVDPGMLIHPPFLLTGLVSTSIPFVLGAAALLSGRLDAAWLRHARVWALASFLILSVGNFLGAWWAYTVLGWGGYWGWDPVENSAILPLFPMTAFLHAAMVQERRGMLKGWNLALVLSAFALAVFGTFNVRSGLVASVHSFAESEVGPYFLVLLGIVVAVSVVLLAWRMPLLRAEHDFDSFASRETGLILNTYVLVALALVVLGGTLFPVFSELVDGSRITVGPPFFGDTTGPIWIAMLLLIALGTVLPWRRAAPGTLSRRLRTPAVVLVGAPIALVLAGMRDAFAIATISAAVVVLYVSGREYYIGARGARRASGRNWLAAFGSLFERDRRRYGGYLVHTGVAVIAIAVIGSTVFQTQVRVTVAPGDQFEVGDYRLSYGGLRVREPGVNGIDQEIIALVGVERDGELVARLEPGQRFFTNFENQPVAIVAIDGSLLRDIYVFIQGWDGEQNAEIQAFINPLTQWLWIGGAIYTLGGLLAFAPARRTAPVRAEIEVPTGARQV